MKVEVMLAAGALLALAAGAWAAPANSSYYAAVREDAPLVYYGFDDSAARTVIEYVDGIVGGKWRMTIAWMPEGGS